LSWLQAVLQQLIATDREGDSNSALGDFRILQTLLINSLCVIEL
jgi:hypothetical protein